MQKKILPSIFYYLVWKYSAASNYRLNLYGSVYKVCVYTLKKIDGYTFD